MEHFKSKKQISQFDYEQLLKLNLINYKNFAQSLLLDPTQDFAVRLSLCEDLVKLGIDEEIKVWILDELENFVPKNVTLLEKIQYIKKLFQVLLVDIVIIQANCQ